MIPLQLHLLCHLRLTDHLSYFTEFRFYWFVPSVVTQKVGCDAFNQVNL